MGKRLLSHMRPPLVYCLAFAGIFALQLMLSRSQTIIQFLLFYELIYLLLGVVSVVGMYLLNKKLPMQ
jgi:predicted tellurium resistance membrane protein TerC